MEIRVWYSSDPEGKKVIRSIESGSTFYLCVDCPEKPYEKLCFKMKGGKTQNIEVTLDAKGFGVTEFTAPTLSGF